MPLTLSYTMVYMLNQRELEVGVKTRTTLYKNTSDVCIENWYIIGPYISGQNGTR